jgi:hypothetical protein
MCQPQPPLLLWWILAHDALGEKFAESFFGFLQEFSYKEAVSRLPRKSKQSLAEADSQRHNVTKQAALLAKLYK